MKLTVEKLLTRTGWQTAQTLIIEKGIVQAIRPATPLECDATLPGILVPGYIDTQVNGGGGVLLNQQPSYDGLCQMANAHLQFGTTGMLPTVITDNADIMTQAADAVAQAIAKKHPTVLGIHFEGPFLSIAKRGVHDAGLIRLPTDAEMNTLTRRDIGNVLTTLAPEQTDVGVIRELVAEGVRVALGHTNATAEQVEAALQAGATGFTHLYNAMSPLTSRAPGVTGAALADANSYCGLIVDHHHVHPTSAKVAINAKGAERIMLVTDAMAHVGTKLERLDFFNTEILRQGDKLTTPEGTLAGSCLDMHRAVLNTHRDLQVSLRESIVMASATPAAFLGLSDIMGSIDAGQVANLLLLDSELNLKNIWLRGEPVATSAN